MPFAYYRSLSRKDKAIYDAQRPGGLHRAAARGGPAPDRGDPAAGPGARRPRARGGGGRAAGAAASPTLLEVEPVDVRVLAVRPELRSAELHGLYTRDDERRPRIRVWMRTLRYKRVVAFRTFLRTLLHEVCHHLDYTLFGLGRLVPHPGLLQPREQPVQAAGAGADRPPRPSVTITKYDPLTSGARRPASVAPAAAQSSAFTDRDRAYPPTARPFASYDGAPSENACPEPGARIGRRTHARRTRRASGAGVASRVPYRWQVWRTRTRDVRSRRGSPGRRPWKRIAWRHIALTTDLPEAKSKLLAHVDRRTCRRGRGFSTAPVGAIEKLRPADAFVESRGASHRRRLLQDGGRVSAQTKSAPLPVETPAPVARSSRRCTVKPSAPRIPTAAGQPPAPRRRPGFRLTGCPDPAPSSAIGSSLGEATSAAGAWPRPRHRCRGAPHARSPSIATAHVPSSSRLVAPAAHGVPPRLIP